jgi:hypothetical protein
MLPGVAPVTPVNAWSIDQHPTTSALVKPVVWLV